MHNVWHDRIVLPVKFQIFVHVNLPGGCLKLIFFCGPHKYYSCNLVMFVNPVICACVCKQFDVFPISILTILGSTIWLDYWNIWWEFEQVKDKIVHRIIDLVKAHQSFFDQVLREDISEADDLTLEQISLVVAILSKASILARCMIWYLVLFNIILELM